MIPDYVGEYLYRRNILRDISTHGERFLRFVEDLARVYPGSGVEGVKREDCACADCV
jgi:hypothetical protein